MDSGDFDRSKKKKNKPIPLVPAVIIFYNSGVKYICDLYLLASVPYLDLDSGMCGACSASLTAG